MKLEERTIILATLEKSRAELSVCNRMAQETCALSLGMRLQTALESLTEAIDEMTGRDDSVPEIEMARRKF